MAQRCLQQAARHALAAVRDVAKSSTSVGKCAGAAVRSLPSRQLQAAALGSLASSPAFQSFRQDAPRFSAASPLPTGFAAAPAVSSMPTASAGAVRTMAGSGGVTEDGDSEESASTLRVRATDVRDDGDPAGGEGDDDASMYSRGGGGGGGRSDTSAMAEATNFLARFRAKDGPMTGRPMGFNAKAFQGQDNADTFELLAFAKEAFMGKDGRSVDIPPAIREVLYQHRWDKVLVDCRRTVTPTKRGKQEAYTAMVATGNMKGLVGLGVGIADTAQLSVAQAYLDSYRRLTTIPLYRGHTIYHALEHDYHCMKIRLMPRPEGWGLKCSDLLYELCGVVGIRNISAKLIGRRKNKFFVAQCFMEALQRQTTPHDGVEATGMYIREVARAPQRLPYGLRATL